MNKNIEEIKKQIGYLLEKAFLDKKHLNSKKMEFLINQLNHLNLNLREEETKLLHSVNQNLKNSNPLYEMLVTKKNLHIIEDLNITVGVYNILKRAGFSYVEDIMEKTDEELLSLGTDKKMTTEDIKKLRAAVIKIHSKQI